MEGEIDFASNENFILLHNKPIVSQPQNIPKNFTKKRGQQLKLQVAN